MLLPNIMKMKQDKTEVAPVGMVPRLVRFPAEDDQWLKAQARILAEARGRATVQDCVREIIRRAREMEAQAA